MKKTRAYTLAEIVITIIVIAIVAAITVKASRAKLDSIITYTYYAGYSTIKTVASQMMVDFSSKEYAGLDPGPNEDGCAGTTPIAHEVCNGDELVCEAGYEYKDGYYDTCISVVRTVPRVGKAASKLLDEQKTFCEKFAEYVNTNENSDALTKSGSNYVQCSSTCPNAIRMFCHSHSQSEMRWSGRGGGSPRRASIFWKWRDTRSSVMPV